MPADEVSRSLEPIVDLFNWTLANGMPAQRVAPQEAYRGLERRQRCAEVALLGALNALNRRRLESIPDDTPGSAALAIKWPDMLASSFMFERLHVNLSSAARLTLSGLDYSATVFLRTHLERASLERSDLDSVLFNDASMVMARLDGASLVGAMLSKARLDAASLVGAKLDRANLRWASLVSAKLDGATFGSANLLGWSIAGASLRSADLSEAEELDPVSLSSAFGVASGIGRTQLPEGVPPPVHWHVAEDAEEDSEPTRDAYQAAYSAWLSKLEN